MIEFEISRKFLEELAKSSERLVDFANQLILDERVAGVVKSIDCRAYQEKLVYEQFVEARLANDESICWWIDIYPEQQRWTIEANVSLNQQNSQIIRELDSRNATTLEEFSDALDTTLYLLLTTDDIQNSANQGIH